MRQQKKSGRARQGDKRAPDLYHGGKAHGPKPRKWAIEMNGKQRLLAFKTVLTAKLFENKIMLIENENIDYPKTKYLAEILGPFSTDSMLFCCPFNPDTNFSRAQ